MMTTIGKHLMATALLATAASAFATLPSPYIKWQMDAITDDGKIRNVGTNTDERCDLTLGDSLVVTNLAGVAHALYYDGTTGAWAQSWTPGLKSRTLSFWLWREPTNGDMDITVNKNHFLFQNLSCESVMVGPKSLFIDLKLGAKEGTNEEIAHSYFYAALRLTRGMWHHAVIVFRDTGLVDDGSANAAYAGVPIYDMTAYMDGIIYSQKLGHTTEAGTDLCSAGTFTVGNQLKNGKRSIYGALAQIQVFDTALTLDEVRELNRADQREIGSGLVGYYPMDAIETVDSARQTPDCSGVGNPLVLGTGVTLTNGVSGSGLWFDATTAAYGSILNPCEITDTTVSFWVNVSRDLGSTSAWGNQIVRLFNWDSQRYLLDNTGFTDVASVAARYYPYADTVTEVPRALNEKGQWSQITVVNEMRKAGTNECSESRGLIYVNGELATEGAFVANAKGGHQAVNATFYLGNNGVGAQRAMLGAFDELALYSRALSADEVRALYHGPAQPEAGADCEVAAEAVTLRGTLATTASAPVVRPADQGVLCWSLVSAPTGGEGACLASPEGLVTRVTLPVPGRYVFALENTLLGFTKRDTVAVTRVAETTASVPTVTLAVSANASLYSPFALMATATGATRLQWLKVSGPGGVWFGTPQDAVTEMRFSAPGQYVVRCRAENAAGAAHADCWVLVLGEAFSPASLETGLLAYWPMEASQRNEVAGGALASVDHVLARILPGVDGYGYQGVGARAFYQTNTLLGEEDSGDLDSKGASGMLIPAEQWRTFSFWMYYDPDSSTNRVYATALLSIPYTMGLWFRCGEVEGMADSTVTGDTTESDLFHFYQQSLAALGGGHIGFRGPGKAACVRQWVHVYAAFDRRNPQGSNETQLWIDGVKQTQTSGGYMGMGRVRNDVPNDCLAIGGHRWNSGGGMNGYYVDGDGAELSRAFPGRIDEVRMYNRLLTTEEIRYLASTPHFAENRGLSIDTLASDDPTVVERLATVRFDPTVTGDPAATATACTYEWRIVEGDARGLSFVDFTLRETEVKVLKTGRYVLQLAVTASDGTVTLSEPLELGTVRRGMILLVK